MSDMKTMPAALEEILRPRRLARVRRAVARSRAEGAFFDAVLWTGFAIVVVGALPFVLAAVELPFLVERGIEDTWLIAGSLLLGLFGAGALWWRWVKWRLLAAKLERRAPGASQLPSPASR